MSKKSKKSSMTWGQFRFSIIGSLLSKPPASGELYQEIEKLSGKHYRHPTKDEYMTFGFSTLERWYYKALKASDPVKALNRKVRSDATKSKVISQTLLTALAKQYANYPNWSYQLHSDNLEALIGEKPELGGTPSYSTVLRQMKKRGWCKKKSKRVNQTEGEKKAAERLEQLEVRSFESEYVNALWHLDFHKGRRIVDVNGKWHTPVALCVIDDRSRLCCHIQWYLNETAEALYHGLVQAFHKRGLPRSLMSDNGSAMIAEEIQNGFLALGIVHDTTLPYSPYQNGKQESFWNQLEGRLLNMLARVEPLSLEFLNQTSQAWIEMEYNRSCHEEINEPPMERFLRGPNVSRQSPDSETIKIAFTCKESRTQRKTDGTIRLGNMRFEIPSRFRHLPKLNVCYQSWDFSVAYLVEERTGNVLARIYPQDKIKNSNGERKLLESLTDDIVPSNNDDDSDPVPPLLRKLIADYAVTGLPAAYIPKEERKIKESEENCDDNKQ